MAQPQKGVAYDFYMSLIDSLDAESFKVSPTIAAEDFTISKDGGAFTNLTTLPSVDPAGSVGVKVSLSATEMNADKIQIFAQDQAGAEWLEQMVFIDVPTGNIDSILNILEGDHSESSAELIIYEKGTANILVQKNISGSLLPAAVVVKTSEP